MPTFILTSEHIPCRPNSPFCEGCGYLSAVDRKGHNWQCFRFGFLTEAPDVDIDLDRGSFQAVRRHKKCLAAEKRFRSLKRIIKGMFKKE